VDEGVGFALDAGGQVQRTMDGGDVWSELGTGTAERPNALYAADQSVVLLFGPKGVRRATSGTNPSFDLVESKAASAARLTDYDRTSGSALFAYGRRALIVSGDDGASWKGVPPPVKNARYRKVDFVTGRLGFALLESGRLFKTRNGGTSWAEVVSIGTARGYDMSFANARNGFVSADRFGRSGRSGWVLRTSDGGATWRPQLIGPQPLDKLGLVAPDLTAAFGLAAGYEFFYTTTGGDLAAASSSLTITPTRTSVARSRLVKITGTLTPAVEGAPVAVLARNASSHSWSVAGETTASAAGTFTISYRVRHTTQLVAQWRGDADAGGAGSPVVTIVKKR
jgi:photosystem II stability/assembly factor-like uncharacterized protein